MALILSVLEQGLIYGVMALGVYITYKILDFPDLTVDGSFPLRAAIAAVMITKGMHPLLTLAVSFAAGGAAGMLTGVIHVTLKVRDLLSGIIMMTALYTVNLRITGKANVPLYGKVTVFENGLTEGFFPEVLKSVAPLVVIAVITAFVKYLLDWYLSTQSGYLLRAAGDNDTFVTSMGVEKGRVKIIGLAIANGLAALGGLAVGGFAAGGCAVGQWLAFGGGAFSNYLAIGGGAVSRGLAIGGAAQGHIAVAKESAVGTYTFVRDVGGTVSGTELWGVIKREFPHMWDWVRDVIQWLLVM